MQYKIVRVNDSKTMGSALYYMDEKGDLYHYLDNDGVGHLSNGKIGCYDYEVIDTLNFKMDEPDEYGSIVVANLLANGPKYIFIKTPQGWKKWSALGIVLGSWPWNRFVSARRATEEEASTWEVKE